MARSRQVVYLRRHMDVNIHSRDSVQQVVAGNIRVPLPYRADVVAHGVLLPRGLSMRAGPSFGQIARNVFPRLV